MNHTLITFFDTLKEGGGLSLYANVTVKPDHVGPPSESADSDHDLLYSSGIFGLYVSVCTVSCSVLCVLRMIAVVCLFVCLFVCLLMCSFVHFRYALFQDSYECSNLVDACRSLMVFSGISTVRPNVLGLGFKCNYETSSDEVSYVVFLLLL